jgi:hypothetical protein
VSECVLFTTDPSADCFEALIALLGCACSGHVNTSWASHTRVLHPLAECQTISNGVYGLFLHPNTITNWNTYQIIAILEATTKTNTSKSLKAFKA